jgi:cation:H+ antiporter
MTYLSVLGGFLLLALCGDLLVRGAVGLATRLGISALTIALTVVALGTSAPELFVSVDAALEGAPDLAIGNVVGSNIANILLVLGLPALLHPVSCRGRALGANTAIMIGVSLLLTALCFLGQLERGQGLLLLVLLGVYFAWSRFDLRTHRLEARLRAAEARALAADVKETGALVEHAVEDVIEEDVPSKAMSSLVVAIFILIGCAGLPLGAHLVVAGGAEIARAFGLSEAAIGLTLVAVGTSLPELATSLMAAWRREDDVAIGNVVGSNIVNILAILGLSSLMAPLPVAPNFLRVDLWVMLLAAFAVLPMVMRRGTITRWTGALFVLAYAIYVYTLLERGGAAA